MAPFRQAVVSVAMLFSFFYMVVVSWSLWYLTASMTTSLEWAQCGHSYNTPDCFTRFDAAACGRGQGSLNGTFLYRSKCTSAADICSDAFNTSSTRVVDNGTACWTSDDAEPVRIDNILAKSSAVEEYWQRYVLGQTHDYTWDHFVRPFHL